MLKLEFTKQFKRDFKKIAKLPLPDVIEAAYVIKQLQLEIPLEEKHSDHALSGAWNNYRDCHIKPDLLLIYQRHAHSIILCRIGSHSELFK